MGRKLGFSLSLLILMWFQITALPGSLLEMQCLEPLHSLALLTSPSSSAIQCFLEPVSQFKNLMKIKSVSPENNTLTLAIMIQPRGACGPPYGICVPQDCR